MWIPILLQRWHEISFFHWSCEPGVLQDRLPPGLIPDRFDGKAWISLTPFLLTGFRFPPFPHALGFNFPEMNLRTYVVGPEGPGIWFFSLDAASMLAVAGARMTYGLPYFSARMAVDIGSTENLYWSQRKSGARATIRIAKEARIADPSPLDVFLTARFRLYAKYGGRLITAEVAHAPWELNRVRVLQFEETVRRTMGVEFPNRDFVCHHSPGVNARIGIPHRSSLITGR
jgi:uncharacterized protein YqjF (DUF2071 family)